MGLNPIDPFDGQAPQLAILSGNNQGDLPNTVLSEPLSVSVCDHNGYALTNVQVQFAITSGTGVLTPINSGTTDANGLAQATFQLPSTTGTISISATAGNTGTTSQVVFTATVGDPALPPIAPDGVSVSANEDGSNTVTWNDNSNNETGFIIQSSTDGVNWIMSGTVGANVTTYTDGSATAGTAFYKVSGINSVATAPSDTNTSAPATNVPTPMQFVVVDLGANCNPRFINNSETVVMTQNGNNIYWSGGTSTTIPLPGVAGLNNNGTVVGSGTTVLFTGTNDSVPNSIGICYNPAYTWSPGGSPTQVGSNPTSIAGLDVTLDSSGVVDNLIWVTEVPVGISDDNTVFGNHHIDNYIGLPVFGGSASKLNSPIGSNCISWMDGGMWGKYVISGGNFKSNTSQNSTGTVLGWSCIVDTSDFYEGYFFSDFDHNPLPITYFANSTTINGYPSSISNDNAIVGYGSDGNTTKLWLGLTQDSNAKNLILGPINSKHQIVSGDAFWQNNKVYSLNNMVAGSGWSGVSAKGINDKGVIIATASYSGTSGNIAQGTHGVLLVPVLLQNFKAQNIDAVVQTSGVYGNTVLNLGDVVFWVQSKVSVSIILPDNFSNASVQPRFVQDVTPNRTLTYAYPALNGGHIKSIMQYQNQKVLDNILDGTGVSSDMITIDRSQPNTVYIESRDQPAQGGNVVYKKIDINDQFLTYLQLQTLGADWQPLGKVAWTFKGSGTCPGVTWSGGDTIVEGIGTVTSELPVFQPNIHPVTFIPQ